MESSFWNEQDLRTLIKVLIPGSPDPERLVRALREDDEILNGMLADERLFRYLVDNSDSLIQVSPRLFFMVLLIRAGRELEHRSYTVERAERHLTFVFDSREVVELLRDIRMREYLVELLVSFVRINSYSTTVQVKKGIWRRFRFSDFDVESLVRYSRTLPVEGRFAAYRRIADVCLFIAGIFPDSVDPIDPAVEAMRPDPVLRDSWEKYARQGEYYYREASLCRAAGPAGLEEVLQTLSGKFILATKPLTFVANHYLRSLRGSAT